MPLPRPLTLARELARVGADVVVVGSTARLLREGAGDPADLDVSVADADLAGLVAALELLGSPTPERRLARGRCVRVDTAWGPLDVFVGSPPPSRPVALDGVSVQVAA